MSSQKNNKLISSYFTINNSNSKTNFDSIESSIHSINNNLFNTNLNNNSLFINNQDYSSILNNEKNHLINTQKLSQHYNINISSQFNNTSQNIDFLPDYCVYTDGSCINNGNCYIGGIGVFFSMNDPRNLSKKIVSENNNKITNNICEISAILEAYNIIKDDINNNKKIAIYTDSEYCLKCLNNFGQKLELNNFSKNIPNKELVIKLYTTFKNLNNVKFFHIKAHTNNNDIHSIGNFNADKLAHLAYIDNIDINGNLLLKHIDFNNYDTPIISKIYLNVPFSKKDIAKKYGTIWDPTNKKWFILSDNTYKDFLIETFK